MNKFLEITSFMYLNSLNSIIVVKKKAYLKCFNLFIKCYIARLISLPRERRDNFKYLEMRNYFLIQEHGEACLSHDTLNY